jgi:hypothetical protein
MVLISVRRSWACTLAAADAAVAVLQQLCIPAVQCVAVGLGGTLARFDCIHLQASNSTQVQAVGKKPRLTCQR